MGAEVVVFHLQAKEHQSFLANARNQKKQKRILTHRFQKVHGPVNTFILDLYPPELWDKKLLLF